MTQPETLAPDGLPVKLVRLKHESGLSLDIMDFGATWLSCKVPMPSGELREVILACARLEDSMKQPGYLGATVGRYANRIAGPRIEYGGKVIDLVPGPFGKHQLHGGPGGFSFRRWAILEQSATHVCFGLHSPDGDQGFPGNLDAKVTYRLEDNGAVSMDCEAVVDRPSPVAFTNHSYFNLDGCKTDARQHTLEIRADGYTPVDAALIPLDGVATVAGTSFDFRTPKRVARDFMADAQQKIGGGYDHAWLLNAECADMSKPASVLCSADGTLRMDLYTTMPAIQFYSGNFLGGTPDREGGSYESFQGLALEPGALPDSPNHPEWPQRTCWVLPGETYRETIRFSFKTS